ncbi:MAG: hypothetical protein RMH75_07155, partial [Archaeoglobaceae archaeon]|nr:hypothetical protein [Archaeoglobaceae archaeon]
QSIVARMLEAIRKEYWNANEEVKIELAKELERLQKEYGFTCCHHTCGNVELLNFKAGILSSIIEEMPKQEQRTQRALSSGGGTAYISQEMTQEKVQRDEFNQTSYGVGFEQPSIPESKSSEKLEGYKVEVSEKPLDSFEISTTPLIAILIVLLALAIFYMGVRMRK